jgi:acetyl esterase
VNDRGQRLDADTWWLIRLNARVNPPLMGGAPAAARRDLLRGTRVVEGRPWPVATEKRLVLGGRPARAWLPHGHRPPAMLYLHGGGWVVGDLRSHERLCRRLASEAGWLVVALDYRLAPEHAFPAGLDDVLAAWPDFLDGIEGLGGDPARVAIGGDSAGGNLAAAACLALRDAGGRGPDLQALIYPAVDLRRGAPSHRLFAEGFLLTKASMDAFKAAYAPNILDPRASPALAASLAGLPPAIVHTAGFDPLRDEGEAYVAALREAGVAALHLDAADLVHGFANMDGALAAADRELTRLAEALASFRRDRRL